jgi:hypothetical protein
MNECSFHLLFCRFFCLLLFAGRDGTHLRESKTMGKFLFLWLFPLFLLALCLVVCADEKVMIRERIDTGSKLNQKVFFHFAFGFAGIDTCNQKLFDNGNFFFACFYRRFVGGLMEPWEWELSNHLEEG